MENQVSLKSRVFKLAHEIKANFDNFAQALKHAWKIAKGEFGKIIKFKFFKKSNGEVREVEATYVSKTYKVAKDGSKIVRFIENGEWRSFDIDTLIG